jgi:peptidoglycan/LPS O-acetylase OafA/YrhL
LIDKPPSATPGEIRKFGILFAAISLVIGGFMVWKGRQLYWVPFGLAGVFTVGGLWLQSVLRPFYIVWMRFAAFLGWVNTRVLLTVFYFVILTPAGIVMKLLGKNPLERRIDRSAGTYWVKLEPGPKDKQRYEHLF